jgi:hypothetical protein
MAPAAGRVASAFVAGWLFVIGEREALRWVLGSREMAFRAHVDTSRLAPGDDVVIYATRGCWHNPGRDRSQAVAVGTIASAIRASAVDVAGEAMPRRCSLDLEVVLAERAGVPFNDLVGRLDLTRGRAHWGMAMRRTIVSLTGRDVATIRRAVEHHARRPQRMA